MTKEFAVDGAVSELVPLEVRSASTGSDRAMVAAWQTGDDQFRCAAAAGQTPPAGFPGGPAAFRGVTDQPAAKPNRHSVTAG